MDQDICEDCSKIAGKASIPKPNRFVPIAFPRCSAAKTSPTISVASLPSARLARQGNHCLAQLLSCRHALAKLQPHRRVTAGKIETVRVESRQSLRPVFRTEKLCCIEAHCLGMIIIYVRDRTRFRLQQILGVGKVG